MVPPAATIAHWATAYLAIGYAKEGGEIGAKNHNCWTFFRKIQQERFGRALPDYAAPPSLRAIARTMPLWAKEFGWAPVHSPHEGDALFMAHLKHATHIGCVAGLAPLHILHCPEGGAVLHSRFHLEALGWRLLGFYRPVA